MIGLFKNMTEQIGVMWPDAELEHISFDYDTIQINITESTNLKKTIVCSGYIGFQFLGVWDEMVIENAIIFSEHPFIEELVASMQIRLGQSIEIDSGSCSRNVRQWKLLSIKFSDGLEMTIVANSFSVYSEL